MFVFEISLTFYTQVSIHYWNLVPQQKSHLLVTVFPGP